MADPSSGVRRPVALAVLVPVGFAVVAAGLTVLAPRGAGVQITVTLLGFAMVYFGVDALLRRLRPQTTDTGIWFASAWLGLVAISAIAVDLLPLSEYIDPGRALSTPSRLRPDLLSAHPLGTDSQGLDILGGVIYGARISLQVSLLAVLVGGFVGGFIGMVAGLHQGRVDRLIGTFTDTVLAFPPLILLLAAVTFLSPGIATIGLALAVVTVPTYIRLARANTLTLVEREFIAAARLMGATNGRIIVRELLPNIVRPVIAYSFVIVAVLIVAEASLSYLGVGIARPTPTWGNMIAAGQQEYERNPHLVFAPGTVMFLTVFALNRVGDWARKAWDPRDSHLP